MKFLSLRILGLSLTFLSSCTDVVTRNFPGEAENSIPANWSGQYIAKLPSALSAHDETGKNTRQYVTIQQDKIIWDHSPQLSVYSLKDSLVISSINGNKYLSAKSAEGYYHVFRVKEQGKELHLFGMYAEMGLEKSDLTPYFRDVEGKDAGFYKALLLMTSWEIILINTQQRSQ